MGRWIIRDPIEEDGGINLYLNFDNNPISKYDPFGLSAETEWRSYYDANKFFADPRVGPSDKTIDKKTWWNGLPRATQEALKKAWSIERYHNLGGGVNPFLEHEFPGEELTEAIADLITSYEIDNLWQLTIGSVGAGLIKGGMIANGTALKLTSKPKSCYWMATCKSIGLQAGFGGALGVALVNTKSECCSDLVGAKPKWIQGSVLTPIGGAGVQVWTNRIGVGAGKGLQIKIAYVECEIQLSKQISP